MATVLSRLFSLLGVLLLHRYSAFLLLLLLYARIMDAWIVQQFGGDMSLLTHWRLEIPLLLYWYFYWNTITRPSRLQAVLTALPVFLLYATFDLHLMQLSRVMHFAEISELPELLALLPIWSKILAGLLLGGLLGYLLLSVQWRRPRPIILGALPLLALLLTVEFLPNLFLATFEKTQAEIILFSEVRTALKTGRVSMGLYNEARRKSMLVRTAHYREHPFYLLDMEEMAQAIRNQADKRNVHLVVLESFLDPELFLDAKFSRRPIHPDFDKLVHHKGSFSISPVFGGGTAQAEFEVLCGVPALREVSGMEFNVFTGAHTPCLPNLLQDGGYHTIATNAFRPEFFNSTSAYAGIGFQKTYYPKEYNQNAETYLTTGDVEEEIYMFDGTLLGQNLDYLRAWFKENPGRPLFNYVLSMYGHTPNLLDPKKRPPIITTEGKIKDWQLENAVNQYYYRTEALAAYVRELNRLDPSGLIILVSDHLPPLFHGPNTYRDLNYLGEKDRSIYTNRIYFLEQGKAVRYDTMHHYDVPRIILNYVTKGKQNGEKAKRFASYSIPFDKDSYHKAYLTIMAHAMNIKEFFPSSLEPAKALASQQPLPHSGAPQPQ